MFALAIDFDNRQKQRERQIREKKAAYERARKEEERRNYVADQTSTTVQPVLPKKTVTKNPTSKEPALQQTKVRTGNPESSFQPRKPTGNKIQNGNTTSLSPTKVKSVTSDRSFRSSVSIANKNQKVNEALQQTTAKRVNVKKSFQPPIPTGNKNQNDNKNEVKPKRTEKPLQPPNPTSQELPKAKNDITESSDKWNTEDDDEIYNEFDTQGQKAQLTENHRQPSSTSLVHFGL